MLLISSVQACDQARHLRALVNSCLGPKPEGWLGGGAGLKCTIPSQSQERTLEWRHSLQQGTNLCSAWVWGYHLPFLLATGQTGWSHLRITIDWPSLHFFSDSKLIQFTGRRLLDYGKGMTYPFFLVYFAVIQKNPIQIIKKIIKNKNDFPNFMLCLFDPLKRGTLETNVCTPYAQILVHKKRKNKTSHRDSLLFIFKTY